MATSGNNIAFYLDDLQVGQKFASATHIVDRERMLAFAADFDPQPFHLSEDSPMLESLAASGWYTAAVTHRLMTTGGLPLASGMIGLSVDVGWPIATKQAMSCASRPWFRRSCPPDPARIAAS